MSLQLFKIADVTVSSPVASVDFTSIPQGYTDLVIKASARNTVGAVQGRILVSFNGLTTNYTLTLLGDQAGTPTSATRAAFGDNHIGYIPGASATASTFGNLEMYVPNYTSANYKSISVDGVMENNSATNYNGLVAGLWSSTAAITSLTLSATFAANSTFTLYGVL